MNFAQAGLGFFSPCLFFFNIFAFLFFFSFFLSVSCCLLFVYRHGFMPCFVSIAFFFSACFSQKTLF